MTSDLVDPKEVTNDLKQCKFDTEDNIKVKPAQGLNPNAQVFYSKEVIRPLYPYTGEYCPENGGNNNLVKDEEDPYDEDDSLNKDDSQELKKEPMSEEVTQVSDMSFVGDNLPIENLSLIGQPQLSGNGSTGGYDIENNMGQEFLDGSQTYDGSLQYGDIKTVLRQQLEYYFSRENLSRDSYLLSQMDSDQYVPISTIANFNQVKILTKDINLIVEVLRESPDVQVDEAGEKVRPCHKRCVLILREIPATTPIKEIEKLFSGEDCPKYTNCEFAHNNNWYITFETDDDAQKAFFHLREEVKTFQGQAIMARIKAKPITRASFSQPAKNGVRPPAEVDPNYQNNPQRFFSIYGNAAATTQVLAPFYPPTMLQAWNPTNPYMDLTTVLAINGLSPQASYKPIANTGRLNYPMIRGGGRGGGGSSKQSYRSAQQQPQQHQSNYEVEHSLYDRNQQQSLAFVRQPPTLINGAAASGFGYVPYPFPNSRNPYTYGLEMHDMRYQKRMDVPPLYAQYTGHNRSGNKEEMSKDGNSSRDYYSNHSNGSYYERGGNRGRRRRRDENGMLGTSKSDLSDTGSISGSKAREETPKFDLEAAAFPPLPGAEEAEADVEVFENRLADVVKGTIKPSSSSMEPMLTNGELNKLELSPPSTPVINELVEERNNIHSEVVCPAKYESSSPHKGKLLSKVDDGGDESLSVNGHSNDVVDTSCYSEVSSAASQWQRKVMRQSLSQDERVGGRRPTYSEVMQRSKDLKDKPEIKETRIRQQEAKPSKGAVKDFSKNRYSESGRSHKSVAAKEVGGASSDVKPAPPNSRETKVTK